MVEHQVPPELGYPRTKEDTVQVRVNLVDTLLTFIKSNPSLKEEDLLASLRVLKTLGVL